MTVRMVLDSLRAGMMIDTIGPELRGASLRLGVRRASRGRVRNGSSQGAAGSSSEKSDSGTGESAASLVARRLGVPAPGCRVVAPPRLRPVWYCSEAPRFGRTE